jgi:hypothetical protein
MDDDTSTHQSADDALEPQDDIFNPALDEETLPEDNDSPAAPASDVPHAQPIDDPATDDEMDSDELYQEGTSGATNSDDTLFDSDNAPPQPLEPEDE